ncbi:MAG: YeeE/YedE thiosulfate transporter family protein [Bacteroidetes bacterium]|nr:YeeE/YedE thiosulfate transporter family protein [Bacteroidota bacterium]MDA1333247.1 YeeE/YedE thiosulfate transporter family protein [Bacteroidota bacterium]
MIEFISQPWPWYVAGPLIGIVVPLLFLVGGKQFGLSDNLRHVCAMLPGKTDFFNYDWRNGSWNLVLMLGIVIGGFIGATWLGNPDPVAISEATRSDLALLGVTNFNGLLPADIYSWEGLGTLRGLILLVGGGFLIGFGTRWAGGCTSGHAISGLADLQLPSLIAVIGFFAGGLIATFLLLPIIL